MRILQEQTLLGNWGEVGADVPRLEASDIIIDTSLESLSSVMRS